MGHELVFKMQVLLVPHILIFSSTVQIGIQLHMHWIYF